MNGVEVLLNELGGGAFDLHFTAKGAGNSGQLTFYTSAGLTGTWRDENKVLPVRLSLISASEFGQAIKDCTLYPTPAPPNGPHFPNPGCEHTPDQKTLNDCIAEPFTSDATVNECIEKSSHPCKDDQYDIDFCIGNIDEYLDQIVEQLLRPSVGMGRVGAENYGPWRAEATRGCVKTSSFTPDGSGYGADIAFCMAAEKLRLIQKGMMASSGPVRLKLLH